MNKKGIEKSLELFNEDRRVHETKTRFQELIQPTQLVGDVYSIAYEKAKVLIHDNERHEVGGIPSLSFLIATRIDLDVDKIDFKAEDSSIILLRVMDAAQLPNSAEAERIRVETAQRVSGTTEHWDKHAMDAKTRVHLGYASIECKIIGTFYLEEDENNVEVPLILKFGSDISNYYPNRGLNVYKPNAEALEKIVNYLDSSHAVDQKSQARVQLGCVRYASTHRKYQQVNDVPVSIYPADLLAQKTALFGMTRTGKSNTTKIIAKSVYELRYPKNTGDEKLEIGQIIFDPNGEYANENIQDKDGNDNPNALKNVWEVNLNAKKEEEVVTYGILKHSKDPDRKLMLINFYLDHNLQIGKEIIDASFGKDESKFIGNFQQVVFEKPEPSDRSATTRYKRRVLAYRSLLAKAGFNVPNNSNIETSGLFNQELFKGRPNAKKGECFNGMLDVKSDADNADKYRAAAKNLQIEFPSLKSLADAFATLYDFMKTAEYKAFERWYVNDRPKASGDNWADEDFKKILEMIWRPNGARQIGKVRDNHSPSTGSDYAKDIYDDLIKGKLVIIDQSSGEPEINKSSAERIIWYIFRENQKRFRESQEPYDILVYIEEAHNLLPSGSDLDLKDVWVRTAKEGAKYRIGMVYSTQEVSSIQKNILKNTANWFIGHLNNTDETSNYFVIPVQVKKFDVKERS